MKYLKNFSGLNENTKGYGSDGRESSDSLICPHCDAEQETNVLDIFDGRDFAEWECESCDKPMECSQSVVYMTRKA